VCGAYLGDGSGLVIPSDQLNSVWVSKFETRKERDGLDAEQASVHIIAFTVTWRLQLAAGGIGQGGRWIGSTCPRIDNLCGVHIRRCGKSQ